MGCDIHICLEKKVNGAWIPVKIRNPFFENEPSRPYSYQVLKGDRDYKLFNIISFNQCRVDRSQLNFVWNERGFNNSDVSQELVDYLTNDSDLHTHSWLTLQELKEAIDDPHEIRSVYEINNIDRKDCTLVTFYESMVEQISHLLPGTDPMDCKIVFAYDN